MIPGVQFYNMTQAEALALIDLVREIQPDEMELIQKLGQGGERILEAAEESGIIFKRPDGRFLVCYQAIERVAVMVEFQFLKEERKA